MLVEIFSDVVCPWCAIGKRRLEGALKEFEHAAEVEVVWRAYELDPHAPAKREGDYAERLARKYGLTREQAVAANARLTQAGEAEGLEFRFDRVQPGNTFAAHRLLHFARELAPGVQGELKERLMQAYFTEGEPIGDDATLVRLATEVGIDATASWAVLRENRYADEVRSDEAAAMEMGVTGVPFFVIDSRFGIPGAQDVDTILQMLRRAWTKAHPEVPSR